jgi:transposase
MQHSLPSDPEVVAIKRARRIIALREQGMSIKQIAAIEGVSDKRIYRIFEKIRRYQARGWM